MTIDVEAIKARCEAATPGPWCWDGFDEFEGKSLQAPMACVLSGRADITNYGNTVHEYIQWDETGDAEFIAHARTDVPALVAEVERLREIVEGGITRDAQDRINKRLCELTESTDIDGTGCDSGCPVDLTISEIEIAIGREWDKTASLRKDAEQSRVLALREAALLAMQWNPIDAGLSDDFDTWQEAMSLFCSHIQKLSNPAAEDE